MPKQISPEELQRILTVVKTFPDGGSIEQVREALSRSIPRRTLLRRLKSLVANNQLTLTGKGPATRYQLTTKPAPAIERDIAAEHSKIDFYPPLSNEGKEIRDAVRKPIQKRQPVGYDRAMLDKYRPNETTYLSAETREKLSAMGRSAHTDHPAGTYARHIFNRLLIDLSWNSSRLEGNTYSLLETERLLEIGSVAVGKDAFETQMILNHKAAIELLVDQAEELGFNRYTILNLHALLSENLLGDPRACGRLRSIAVGIGGTVYHPLEVPQLIEECFDQILQTASAILDPFEQSFFAMTHLPYLQPFEDVNKRVSRLAANLPLIRENLSPLSFVDVPEQAYIEGLLGVYELNRVDLLMDVFVWAYERSCARYSAVRKSLGQPDEFRLRYKSEVARIIGAVVKNSLGKTEASSLIRNTAQESINTDETNRFIEIVETELMSLHEGNIARYRLRPEEYRKWKETWC